MRCVESPLQQAARLKWVDGSALTWRDLRDGVAAEEAMLALHMRGLHDTWGVALGLTTVLASSARSVLVTPGFAITCVGLPILLPAVGSLPMPPADGAWDVVLTAPALREGDPCYRPTTCDLAETPRVATISWHQAGSELDQRSTVVLGSFVRSAATAGLVGPDLQARRGVRVLERPHVSGGVVPPGGLTWTADGHRLVATIDTSAAGFSQAAAYRTWVAAHGAWPNNVIAAFLSVASASRSSMQVQLLLAGGASVGSALIVAGGLTLGWLGVEPVRGCPPAFSTLQIAQLLGSANLSLWSAALAAIPGFKP